MNGQPTRLFDLPQYQLERYPKADMLSAKENGHWIKYSCQEVNDLIISLAAGLLRLGIQSGDLSPEGRDKVAIISGNRPEWIIADQACQQIGAILVPVYPTVNPHELTYILKDASVKLVFAGDKGLYEMIAGIRDGLPDLREVFSFDRVEDAGYWRDLCVQAALDEKMRINQIKSAIAPHHIATIIFTSGTTGVPKGVMLSHRNILSNVLGCFDYLPVDKDGWALSFLPLNHVYERMITYLYIYGGVSIYFAESMDSIGANLREVKPFIFTTVPRLLEKVYERITEKGMELKGIKKWLFDWSLALGGRYEINRKMGWWYDLQLRVARRLVFSKWREALGGNVQAIVTGSAACQVRLLKLFTAAGVNILEGYGLTETSPVISVNRINFPDRMFGTVGPVIRGVDIRIAGDGEILCKGPNVMEGYYRQPGLTAEVITDGWFHTGDIGSLVDGKFLKITDRKKELFKTSGGKYVAPQPIENKMKESPFIAEIMVIGADRKFPAALIVPDFRRLKDWAEKNGLPSAAGPEMIRLPEVVDLFRGEVNRYNVFFNHVEQVKKFELMGNDWTIESGELSQAMKMKRKVILEKYQDVIKSIYR